MTIPAALAEAYASIDNSGFIYDTIQISHIALPESLYFLRGQYVKDEYETVTLPTSEGLKVFTVVDFMLQRPGQEDGGVTRAKLRIDNVSRIIQNVLREVIASDRPFNITYRCYWSEDINNPEVFTGLKMAQVAVTPLTAEGELYYDEAEMKAFPGEVYDITRFAALYAQ